MKSIIIMLFIFYMNLTNTQKVQELKGDVLTLAIKGKAECRLPGSVINRGEGDLNELMQKLNADAIGTGFVYEYNNEKYVITCDHVIGRGKTITAYDAKQNAYPLEWLGADIFYDLSVLKFKEKQKTKKLKKVDLKEEYPHIGEVIYSYGFWNLDGTVNKELGEVRQTNFTFKEDNVVAGKMNYIVCNEDLDLGFSGGPASDKKGRVVGMNTKRYSGYKKAFILDSQTVIRVAENIIDHGGMKRVFAGIKFVQNVDTTKAVTIDMVFEDSPAGKHKDALLHKTVTRINKQTVNTIFDVLHIMEHINTEEGFFIEVQSTNGQMNEVPINYDDQQIIDQKNLEKIARYAISENDTCTNIQEIDGRLTITLDNDQKILPTTFGLRLNEQDYLIYCVKNLAHFGTLTRLLSLYGIMEIDKDGEGGNAPIKIYLSREPNQRVLYY